MNCCILQEKNITHYYKDSQLGIPLSDPKSSMKIVKASENQPGSMVLKFHYGNRQCRRHSQNINSRNIHRQDSEIMKKDAKKCDGMAADFQDYKFSIFLEKYSQADEVDINDSNDIVFCELKILGLTPKDIMDSIDRHR